MGYRVGSVRYCRPDGVVQRMWPVGSCSAFQRGSCLSPVVVAAGRVPVAQAGPAARFVRDVVLEVGAR